MGFDVKKIHDPKFFKENCMAAHSDHVTYKNEAEAVEQNSSFRLSLDGIWKFHYAKNDAQTIPGFEAEDYNCRPWDDIRVPAHIQMEGYEIFHSMPISSIRGMEERMCGVTQCRQTLTRWQVM